MGFQRGSGVNAALRHRANGLCFDKGKVSKGTPGGRVMGRLHGENRGHDLLCNFGGADYPVSKSVDTGTVYFQRTL